MHGTTRRIIAEHFAEERSDLKPLPAGPICAVLHLERRITCDGMISVGGNQYSVPDSTRRRVVEARLLADEVRIFEAGQLIATHPVLDGRGQRRIAAGHRHHQPPANDTTPCDQVLIPERPGELVPRRSLAFYAAVGSRLAAARLEAAARSRP